jgi:hypothetical protein
VSSQPNDTTAAFTTPLPGGSYPHATPASIRGTGFPIDLIEKDVASVLGTDAKPARYAALRKLSGVTDPAAFTAASARTAFGPVDVFILQRTSPARWTWQPFDAPGPAITFTPAQFSPDAFTVFTNLPGNLVLAVRQPQRTS